MKISEEGRGDVPKDIILRVGDTMIALEPTPYHEQYVITLLDNSNRPVILAHMEAEEIDQVVLLRSLLSDFFTDTGIEYELNIACHHSGNGQLICLPVTGRSSQIREGHTVTSVYALGRGGGSPYCYVEERVVDPSVGPMRATRTTWRGRIYETHPEWLNPANVSVSIPPDPVAFRGWLAKRLGVPTNSPRPLVMSYADVVQRLNVTGNDAVASRFAQTWRPYVDVEALERLAAYVRAPGGKPATVLDLGCGPGIYAESIAAKHWQWVGLDVSAKMLKEAKSAQASGLDGIQGSMSALPFAGGTFDVVWLRASLVHIPRIQVPIVLGEGMRVLRPGGIVYVNVQTGVGSIARRDGRVFFYYDRDTMCGFFRGAGLTILEEWRDSTSIGSWGDTRTKEWHHFILSTPT